MGHQHDDRAVSSGYPHLNEATGGLCAGKRVLFASRLGCEQQAGSPCLMLLMGKTALLLSIVADMTFVRHRTVWLISLDESSDCVCDSCGPCRPVRTGTRWIRRSNKNHGWQGRPSDSRAIGASGSVNALLRGVCCLRHHRAPRPPIVVLRRAERAPCASLGPFVGQEVRSAPPGTPDTQVRIMRMPLPRWPR